jgi:SAM-dependent methyltransferase
MVTAAEDHCLEAQVIEGYGAVTEAWIAGSEALDCAVLYAPVLDLLPVDPVVVADIGAGSGRDAAWFCRQGHDVTAIEPTALLSDAGKGLYGQLPIRWIDDRLPHLEHLPETADYDLIVVNGVWQHLEDDQRRIAMQRIAMLTASGGRLILSLRHGPGAATRPVRPIDPDLTIELAGQSGFRLLRRQIAGSLQDVNRAAGVRWTWLALEKTG